MQERTVIQLKEKFGRYPVSRAEAKHLCDGLDQFKEVQLDFDGLDWMGQGFAHQVFVVFQNEHPQIKLVPINMNDDTEKMYKHVMA